MGCDSSKSSPVSSSVLVLGATGNIGKATVYTLKKYNVNVTAGVRDPNSKEAQEFAKQGIKVIQADMSSDENVLTQKIKGYESVLVNTPPDIQRQKIAINAAKAVQKAGAKYVLIVSVLLVEDNILFGRQLKEVEDTVKTLGINYGFLRLPFFMDNLFAQVEPIKQGQLYGPIDGDLPFIQVSVQDAGNAAAKILSHWPEYKNQVLTITSDKKSFNQQAKEFSSVLGKEVKYINVGYEPTRTSMISHHVPEWQADGILEIYKLVEKSTPSQLGLHNSFYEVTNTQPTSFKQWVQLNAGAFGGVPQK